MDYLHTIPLQYKNLCKPYYDKSGRQMSALEHGYTVLLPLKVLSYARKNKEEGKVEEKI